MAVGVSSGKEEYGEYRAPGAGIKRGAVASFLVLWLLILSLQLSSCRSRERVVTPAFYHWKTAYRPGSVERDVLRRIGSRKLYLRICDIGWNEMTSRPEPHDPLRVGEGLPAGVEPVPVIFLQTPVLQHLSDPALIDALAQKVAVYAAGVCDNAGWAVREFQLDCDWTATTAATYFALLQALKRQPFLSGKTFSVTVRLHQVKYVARAGVPPADRGMLMCYNMGTTKKPEAHNSILDVDEAKDYLKNLEAYPLPLDLALPVFRWCLWYRDGRLVGILRDVEPDDCPRLPFLQRERGALYRCTRDADWGGYPLRAGDRIRAEAPSPAEVGNIAAYAAHRLKNDSCTVAFYHLDPNTLKKFPPHALARILDRCR